MYSELICFTVEITLNFERSQASSGLAATVVKFNESLCSLLGLVLKYAMMGRSPPYIYIYIYITENIDDRNGFLLFLRQ